jgi:hypothetical protein
VKTTGEPDFKKQLTSRLKGERGDSKKDSRHTKFLVEEYAALLTKARFELLDQVRTPAVSDVEAGVNTAFQVGCSLPSCSISQHDLVTSGESRVYR